MLAVTLDRSSVNPLPEPPCEAVLSQSITYYKEGVTIIVLAGTRIIYDMDRECALMPSGDHVAVFADEFTFVGVWN